VESQEGIGSQFWVELLFDPKSDTGIKEPLPEASADQNSFGA
jgi:hypothetical protein